MEVVQFLPDWRGDGRVVDLVIPVGTGKVGRVHDVHSLVGKKGLERFSLFSGGSLFPAAVSHPCRGFVDGLPVTGIVSTTVGTVVWMEISQQRR